MSDDDLTCARKALIDAIISAYHTTRLADAPVAAHVLAKPMVVAAFAKLREAESGRA